MSAAFLAAYLYYSRGLGISGLVPLVLAVVLLSVVLLSPHWSPILGFAVIGIELFGPAPWLRPLVLGAVTVGVLLGWANASPKSRRVAALLLGLALWVALVGAILAPAATGKWGLTLQLVFACVVAASLAIYRTDARAVFGMIAAIGALYAFKALTLPDIQTQRSGDLAFGENADSLGAGIALGGLALMCLLRGRVFGLIVALSGMVFYFDGIAATASRGAVLVLAVGVVALLTARYWRDNGVRAISGGLTALVVAGLFGEELLGRFLDVAGRQSAALEGVDVRQSVIQFGLQQGRDHPLTGIGIGRLGDITASSNALGLAISAHNAYVGTFAAVGIPGTLLFIGLALFAVINAYRADAVALCALALGAVLAGMTMEWQTQARLSVICFGILALAATAERTASEKKSAPTLPRQSGRASGSTADGSARTSERSLRRSG